MYFVEGMFVFGGENVVQTWKLRKECHGMIPGLELLTVLRRVDLGDE